MAIPISAPRITGASFTTRRASSPSGRASSSHRAIRPAHSRNKRRVDQQPDQEALELSHGQGANGLRLGQRVGAMEYATDLDLSRAAARQRDAKTLQRMLRADRVPGRGFLAVHFYQCAGRLHVRLSCAARHTT